MYPNTTDILNRNTPRRVNPYVKLIGVPTLSTVVMTGSSKTHLVIKKKNDLNSVIDNSNH